MKLYACVILAFLLSGCAMLQPPAKISSPYDSATAKEKLKPGTNTVTGSAMVRQRGGGVVTCAGNKVKLFPSTPYTDERHGLIISGSSGGFVSPATYRGPFRFDPDPAEYKVNVIETLCDAQGKFEFRNVADGDFYVTTEVMWQIEYSTQGGLFVRKVSLQGGETKSVILAP